MRELRVRLRFAPDDVRDVGTLAQDGRRVWFEYDAADGLPIAPLGLPRGQGLIEHTPKGGVPIPGVFSDARPDGWGLKLLHRAFQGAGRPPSSVSALDELAWLGHRTMGALVFEPPTGPPGELADAIELGALAAHARQVYDDDVSDVLPDLVRAGASSGGARPKALIGLRSDGGPGVVFGEGDLPSGWDAWLVKFPTSSDDEDVARRELVWMELAAACGVDTPEARVLSLGEYGEAFAVRRFDRPGDNRRLHMLSAAGALDVDFRTAVADYEDLLRLTGFMTQGDQAEVQALFRLAAFNVLVWNQDDHLKNLGFLMDPGGRWRLSPAYDLTYAPSPGGERATLVAGRGAGIGRPDLQALGRAAGLRSRDVDSILCEVVDGLGGVAERLGERGCTGPVSQAARQAVEEALEGFR